MTQQSLPLAYQRSKPEHKRTNLWLPIDLKVKSAALARERYNLSLSLLVVALLKGEMAHKRGLLRKG